MWELRLFGGFRLISPRGTELVTRSVATREAIALLALAGGDGIGRAALATELDYDGVRSPERSLNVLLFRLRERLAEDGASDLVVQVGDRMFLNSQVIATELDLLRRHIRSAVEPSAPLMPMLQWLGGLTEREFLPGPYRSRMFERMRADLAAEIFGCVLTLSRTSLGFSERKMLAGTARTLGPYLPADLSAAEMALRAYGNLGLKDGLLETFLVAEERLAEDFGEAPPARLSSLVEMLVRSLDEAPAKSGPPTPSVPLFGRGDETDELIRLLSLPPSSILVCGGPGIGKSHVLHHLVARRAPRLPKDRLCGPCEALRSGDRRARQ